MENSIVYISVISKRAGNEIKTSWTWYEDRQFGLGDRFYKDVFDTV